MPSTITKKDNPIPLYSLFTANAISLIGNVITMIAIPWFVLQTTGSATQTGIIGFFTILPVVLAGFFGGTFIDRLGFKRTSILFDLASNQHGIHANHERDGSRASSQQFAVNLDQFFLRFVPGKFS